MKPSLALKATLALSLSAVLTGLHAFPTKTISLVVPYPAGGPSDFVARKLQPETAAQLKQTMIIDNVGGAGGSIAMAKVLNSPADGHTLAVGSPMELVLAPLSIQGVKYAPEDFRLVAQFTTTSTVLAVRASLNARTVDELINLAKKNPSQPLSYGSVGNGSLYHLAGEKFAQLTKAPMLHVPYKGIAPLISDLMGGQIDMAFLPLAGGVQQSLVDGKIRGIAVTSRTPHPVFKQYPAMAAMPGLEAMEFSIWAGVQVHKNTPPEVIATLNKAFYTALENPDTRKALESAGATVLPARSPAELNKLYQGEIERYRGIARAINLQAQ